MIAPRYLPRLSGDLSAFDLFVPATDEDFEWALRRMLPPLASLPWRLNRTERVTLARLRKEWGRPGELPASEVKRGLLCLAVARLLREMFKPERVRFGETWHDGSRAVRPAVWLYGGSARESSGDTFDLSTCPTAEDVDRFGRWAEQRLIGYARAELCGMATDVLGDGLRWLRGGPDILDHPGSITTSLAQATEGLEEALTDGQPQMREGQDHWETRFHIAMHGLGRLLTRARYLALLSCFERIYAHRSGKGLSRRQKPSVREFKGIQRNMKKIKDQQRIETTPLVLHALEAIRELAACEIPPPDLEAVIRRHTRNPRTKHVRAR